MNPPPPHQLQSGYSMTLVARNVPRMYSVYEDDRGEVYIEVLAGGAAMYFVRARLDDREKDLYRDQPVESGTIALRLLKWPDRFEGRLVSDEEWHRLTVLNGAS